MCRFELDTDICAGIGSFGEYLVLLVYTQAEDEHIKGKIVSLLLACILYVACVYTLCSLSISLGSTLYCSCKRKTNTPRANFFRLFAFVRFFLIHSACDICLFLYTLVQKHNRILFSLFFFNLLIINCVLLQTPFFIACAFTDTFLFFFNY